MSNLRLYAVVSETLYETIDLLGYGQGPREPYAICEIVSARSREQARYLAWQKDNSFDHDCSQMPNFHTCCIGLSKKPKGVLNGPLSQLEMYWKTAAQRSETLFKWEGESLESN